MDGRFDVTRAGLVFGVAELSENGLMQDISFAGSAPDDKNVYRLAAVCAGQYVALGVPVPDKSGTLTLKKSLSRAAVRVLGFVLPSAFELVLPGEECGDVFDNEVVEFDNEQEIIIVPPMPELNHEPEPETKAQAVTTTGRDNWRNAPNPSVMFTENGALSAVDDIVGALIREDGEFIHLVIPVSDGEPFPLMSAFCLGEPQTINGGEYLVFKLKNGAFTA